MDRLGSNPLKVAEGAPFCTVQYSMSKRYFAAAKRFVEGSLKQNLQDAAEGCRGFVEGVLRHKNLRKIKSTARLTNAR